MLATRVLAPNPGPMTLAGTNSFVVRHPDSHRIVVVDPGPLHPLHLRRLASHGRIELILLTHYHEDHAEGARRLSAMTDAPVRARDAACCVKGRPLEDDEEIQAGGTRLRVLATPGHTWDSVCFYLEDDRDPEIPTMSGSMLTGDTILGRGSPAVTQPDGSLQEYISSLRRLSAWGPALVLPGHGSRLNSLSAAAVGNIDHRLRRLREVAAAVERVESGGSRERTVASIADLIYPSIAPELRAVAEKSVRAQLAYLDDLGRKPCGLPSSSSDARIVADRR